MKQETKHTERKWVINLGGVITEEFTEGYKIICTPDDIEDARIIVKCVNTHNELVNIAKRTIFMFSNEANYPYGTQGYLLAMDAKAVLKKVTDTEPIKQ